MRRRSHTLARFASAQRSLGVAAVAALMVPMACSSPFNETRDVPKRGSVGRELYGLVCDRIGAQALREDVTGASFHAVCHPDASGAYAAHVDQSLLVDLAPDARDVDGKTVALDVQLAHRKYRVARIESLAARREDLVVAFDAILPDEAIPTRADDTRCDPPLDPSKSATGPHDRLLSQLAATLSRFIDLYNDETVPLFTRSLGGALGQVESDPKIQAALARLDARRGYRPAEVALGVVRPVVAYPRMVALTQSLLRLVASDSAPYDASGAIDPSKPLSPDNRAPIPGKASAQFQALLSVLHHELRTPSATASTPTPTLVSTPDSTLAGREILSRPRTSLELARRLLLARDPAFATSTSPVRPLVERDRRAYASVPLVGGKVPSPFVDLDGDGLPDLDALGQFITVDGKPSPTPLPARAEASDSSIARDAQGRALSPVTSAPMYGFLDASRTFMAPLVRNVRALVEPDASKHHETLVDLLTGLPVIAGRRDDKASTHKAYSPDPFALEAWALTHAEPPPATLAKTPVDVAYRGYHPESSPAVDLFYALGQIVADPAVDDALALVSKLIAEHPHDFARLVGLGLRLKAIADAHPEAHLPASSMMWDDLLATLEKLAHAPGVLEDLFRALGKDESLKIDAIFAAYAGSRDVLAYNPDDLNGPALNTTVGTVAPLSTPVDRASPDVGDNRSALQKFMQLLHDANGLGACTKQGAIAHVNIKGGYIPLIPFDVALDYPTSPLVKIACPFFGASAPSEIPVCGVLRFPNVAALLLDVALDRATFDIRDDCLNKIAHSPVTGLVGGVDAFLEQISGINGLSTHPTVAGIARLVYVNTPHNGLGGDANPNMAKTVNFLTDILDPVPSMVCDPAPFTDSDGTVVQLRKCTSFADTLRGRDFNSLFPIEQMNFVQSVRPLAAAFADHGQSALFVELFDKLHLHWGSSAQPADVCDPSRPPTDFRWCSQDGAVSYEATIVDMLKTDLFPVLHDLIGTLAATTIPHCDTWDTTTHTCTATSARDGVQVMAEATRVMLDSSRWPSLVDRAGHGYATRNDGTQTPALSPIYLFIDGLKGVDATFAKWATAHPGDDRVKPWRSARSQLVDQFLSVDGTGATATFHEPAVPAILPVALDTLRAQVFAHCPDAIEGVAGATCPWAQRDLVSSVSSTLSSPTFATSIDLLEAIRADANARAQIESLIAFLLDAASDDDAQATTLTAAVDALQVLDDDVNLDPIARIAADATIPAVVDSAGKVVRRGLVDGAVEALAHIFAVAYDGSTEVCSREVDPNQAIDAVLKKLLTPISDKTQGGATPLEVISSVIADVNRADPSSSAKLSGDDYRNIASEVREFLLNKSSGLEQVYEVIREATLPKAKAAE